MIEELKTFGLSEKEAKTYLAGLELGVATANDISLKSKLPRTLAYDILERLIHTGLMSYSIKEGKKYFTAADPNELRRILKEKDNAIQYILPKLQTLYKMKGQKRPKIDIFEGKKGLKMLLNEILETKTKTLLVYGSTRASSKLLPAFMEDWHTRRIQKKIFIKAIYNNTPEARERVKRLPQAFKYGDYRFMPITAESPTATAIYGDTIFLLSWTQEEPFAVRIHSKEMAENNKHYFEALWNFAKK
ncbi:hypothetical protein COV18_04150 [Candidatus Woesearchaeota archaeon CG10_big_fil_rev_8_21_14_0_10_37_12]|nr:MAG: hypothetical protein COV18_04150 [Candidatus Woesearchaeota archaeon CG10_big_fil_rev_8_21_14_0_10_37_12]